MGASSRHYKALMKKNLINWKRTPCGSIFEILLPILLMCILVYARIEIIPEELDNYSIYSLRHALYPVAKPNPDAGGNYTIEMFDQLSMMQDLTPFMSYADYININTVINIPVNETIEILDLNGVTNAIEDTFDDALEDVSENYEEYFDDLKELIETTPLANFTDVINWGAL